MANLSHMTESGTGHIRTAEARVILKCSQRTIIRMVEDGRLVPVQKFPTQTGGYMFDRADVMRLAAGQDKAAAPQ